jgi:hypothetical protein
VEGGFRELTRSGVIQEIHVVRQDPRRFIECKVACSGSRTAGWFAVSGSRVGSSGGRSLVARSHRRREPRAVRVSQRDFEGGRARTLARVAQLTQKTNQFNLTTRRYTELNAAYQCLREPKERLQLLIEMECGRKPEQVQPIDSVGMSLFTEPVWFYVRGEEYSAQLDYFVRCIEEKRADNVNSFENAVATDRVMEMMVADASRGPAVTSGEAPAPKRKKRFLFG